MSIPPKMCVGYVRVSGPDQATSIAIQKAQIADYAKLRGLELRETFVDEAVSGGRLFRKRPEGKRLLSTLRERRYKIVIVAKLDRLSRNLVDGKGLIDGWLAAGIHLHICDMGGCSIDASSAAGGFMLSMLLSGAEFERKMASERISTVARTRRTAKLQYTGKPPFGYRNERGKVVADAREQKAVRRIITLRGRGETYEDIAMILEKEGHKNRAGDKAISPKVVWTVAKRELEGVVI